MIVAIPDILAPRDLGDLQALLAGATYSDGRASAGSAARLVKSNLQANDGAGLEPARLMIHQRLLEHQVFASVTRPKTIIGPTFSRYEPGHTYGPHVDDAMMAGVRTDVSFTVFLSHPDSYDGGELIIETTSGDEAFKLAAGGIVTYPATFLHRVAPVTRGVRSAAVGWVRSYIRDAARREILFDLDAARQSLFHSHGKTTEFDKLSKVAGNLLRMWVDD